MEKLKVVIADDNRQFNMLLTEVFNSQPDFLVVGNSYDGIETLKVVEEKKPDLLMLDIIMPYLDGIGVIENLSSVEKRPNIIVISAVGQENISQKAINMGALYYFVKPFDLNIMIERVRQLLISTSSKSETAEINFSKPAEKKPVSELDIEAEVTCERVSIFERCNCFSHYGCRPFKWYHKGFVPYDCREIQHHTNQSGKSNKTCNRDFSNKGQGRNTL